MRYIVFLTLLASSFIARAQYVPICKEKCTVTSSTATTTTYYFGVIGTKVNIVSNPKYPLVIDCQTGCSLLGGDPAPNVAKTIYAIQQAKPYSVTWIDPLGNQGTVVVPAPGSVFQVTCTATIPATATGSLPSTITLTNATCKAVKQ